jgi:hypothetical protein
VITRYRSVLATKLGGPRTLCWSSFLTEVAMKQAGSGPSTANIFSEQNRKSGDSFCVKFLSRRRNESAIAG